MSNGNVPRPLCCRTRNALLLDPALLRFKAARSNGQILRVVEGSPDQVANARDSSRAFLDCLSFLPVRVNYGDDFVTRSDELAQLKKHTCCRILYSNWL